MTKEEIKQFIKENLSIKIEVDNGCYGSRNDLTVKLMLDDECISESSIDVPTASD